MLFFSFHFSPFIKLKFRTKLVHFVKSSVYYPPYIKRHNSIKPSSFVINQCPQFSGQNLYLLSLVQLIISWGMTSPLIKVSL
ncbi:hypothetical protein CW304_02625 [Bacillus sp. UFRGS-B20]|nr:hypothetical protein CW304_02625 [Bacillus sp. UFRGS-B20]